MKNFLKKIPVFFALLLFFNCDVFKLTDAEIAAGLKEALTYGSKYALNKLGVRDGFFLDNAVKIGLPDDVTLIVKQISAVPLFKEVIKEIEQDLVLTINRAAESSIEEVIPIVVNAITDMTIQDAKTILFSDDNIAATNYLHTKTYDPLCDVCESAIEGALNKKIVLNTSAQDVWKKFTDCYNTVANIPLVNLDPVETNLATYTTQKTLNGVFVKIGDEEIKIRTDITARVTDLLRKVFGELDN
jgi:hypothetical protein